MMTLRPNMVRVVRASLRRTYEPRATLAVLALHEDDPLLGGTIDPATYDYVKVAEFQARGLVHFHAIIRLDNATDRALSPGLKITADELCTAIREAAGRSRRQGHAGGGEVVELRFGKQIDTRVLHGAEDGRELCPEQVAAYVASTPASAHTARSPAPTAAPSNCATAA
jgi:replication initiator protein RepSA